MQTDQTSTTFSKHFPYAVSNTSSEFLGNYYGLVINVSVQFWFFVVIISSSFFFSLLKELHFQSNFLINTDINWEKNKEVR